MSRRRYRRQGGGSAAIACASILFFIISAFVFQSMIANLSDYSLLAYQRVYTVYCSLSNATRDPTESLSDFSAFFNGVRALASYVNGAQLSAPYLILDFFGSTLFPRLMACLLLLSAAIVLMTLALRNPYMALAAVTVALVAIYFAYSIWNIASILSLETRIVQLICFNVDSQLTKLYGPDWSFFLRNIHGISLSPRDLFNPSVFSMFYLSFAESYRAWILEIGAACMAASALIALAAAKAAR
ncbi:MAG: hypothetical protein QXN15_05775 [Candidatus Jordarchaeales archaeon]|nr:hypothetical protein [Candidatus Jordarchaeia archaeon]